MAALLQVLNRAIEQAAAYLQLSPSFLFGLLTGFTLAWIAFQILQAFKNLYRLFGRKGLLFLFLLVLGVSGQSFWFGTIYQFLFGV